eukprot:scaffold27119_cov19-Tisochrysis_lutea.AAC.1
MKSRISRALRNCAPLVHDLYGSSPGEGGQWLSACMARPSANARNNYQAECMQQCSQQCMQQCAQQCMQQCTQQCCADDALTLACAPWHALLLSWAFCLMQLNGAITEAISQ